MNVIMYSFVQKYSQILALHTNFHMQSLNLYCFQLLSVFCGWEDTPQKHGI